MMSAPPVIASRTQEAELEYLRLEIRNYRLREEVARGAYLKLKGESEGLRKDLAAERLSNSSDRRRLDLLVALCQRASRHGEGVRINTGEQLLINPTNLRAALDVLLEAGVKESLPA